MRSVTLKVNGRMVSATIEPRTHLADFLREHLNLTGTHLRCEQGACGACTVLIDGQPARSCITYAALCDGADVETIEGLRDDPVMLALHVAFSKEHALQCGFCTPGMLVSARDIVRRLPDASADRIRLELSGNLCRCTGYVGIVRAISSVLDDRRVRGLATSAPEVGPIGPVGSRNGAGAIANLETYSADTNVTEDFATLGLNGRKPTLEMNNQFKLNRSPDEVWTFFANPMQVVGCLPGASLSKAGEANEFDGRMTLKLGPISAKFAGRARISRNDRLRFGLIVGSGRDSGGGSLASGELRYSVKSAQDNGGTLVDLNTRILIAGPLAQFARAGIVNELLANIIERFEMNVEAAMAGGVKSEAEALPALSLFWSVIMRRIRKLFSH